MKKITLLLCGVMLLALFPLSAAAEITVKGIISDSNGEPLPGASIMIVGTTKGTITDVDGKYHIDVDPTGKLKFSFIGMKAVEIPVDKRTTLNITLEDEATTLDDVVVIGYGSIQRKDVTTSVVSVSTKDINERPLTTAIGAIQGKAAGVNVVQPSGEPGGSMVIRVRGNSSIASSNDPLYVVDGVPMTDIKYLSPNDVESIQVLKDASSAAIYGSRASNGVVLITTMQGAKGVAKITFNGQFGFSNVLKHTESLNVAQYSDLMTELGGIVLPAGLRDETDWFKETYRTASTQNYQLSITNGTDKMRYFISGGYTQENGVIPVAYFRRYNMRVNLENKIRPWLTLGTNISYSDYNGNGIVSGEGANRAGVVLSVINTPTYAPIWNPEKPDQYYDNFYGAEVTSPVENMSRTADNTNGSNRLIASVSAEIKFCPWLTFRSTTSLDRDYNHLYTFLDPIKTAWGRQNYGVAYDSRSLSTVMVYDNVLNFQRNFALHNLSAMIGTSGTTSDWNNTYQTASHFLSNNITTLNAGNKVEQINGTSASQWAIMSYLARVSYNYDSRYLITANIRADGSSKLAPGKRWGYFPSASAAWRISSEEWLQNIEWLNDLKLRGGWGSTGNQSGIGDYSYLQQYNIVRQNWWETGKENALPILVQSNMRNRDLTWETTSQTNIGIDLTAFRSRLTFTADFYYKYTTNLLMNVPLPSTASASNIYRNEAEMMNKGMEFSISSKNFVGAFSWNTDFNISFNQNKVTKLTLEKSYFFARSTDLTSEYVVHMVEGKPLGMFWGYESEGVNPETGDIIYRDINGDGAVTPTDKTFIGNPNPTFTFGLTNTLSYKNFTLSIFLQGSVGNDIYNISRMETEGMYDDKNQAVAVLDRWRIPGQITDMPRAVRNSDNLRASSRFVEDGSYLRVKNVILSYEVSRAWLKKFHISRLQPYITAQNLVTFTSYKGFDPEVNQYGGDATMQGIDYGTYPQSRTFVIGLNVEF